MDWPPAPQPGVPLENVRVVEAASYVTGPFAAMMLAQLGASVVKVEPPRGDPFRRFGYKHNGTSAFWTNVNHGKRSLVLDLKVRSDLETMLELIAEADIFIQNWRPGVASSLGLGADELLAANPELICVCINGFGNSGPRSSTPSFDGLLQAASGFVSVVSRGEELRGVGSAIMDKVTSLFVVQAALAALHKRSSTGRGAVVDLAMLDVAAHFNFPDLAQHRTFLPPAVPPPVERGASGIVATKDGFLQLAPVSGRQLVGCITAVGHPEWKDELKATTTGAELTTLLFDRVRTITPSKTTQEWERIFAEHDVPVVPVLTLDEHFADAQVLHNAIYFESESPTGPVRRVRHPARVDGDVLPPVPPAPSLGS